MRRIVIAAGNSFLSEALSLELSKNSNFLVVKSIKQDENSIINDCYSLNADILFMDVTRGDTTSIIKRLNIVSNIRKLLKDIKIALYCDHNSDPEIAEKVQMAKKAGIIDTFFYESVKPDYLIAILGTL